NPDPRAAMARLYLTEGKKPEAVRFLQQAKQDFSTNSAGYRMLGDFYFVTGDTDNALSEYANLYKEHPKDQDVKKNYVELLILKNDLAEARKLNDEVLKSEPNDNQALILHGQLQLRAGEASGAVSTLQAVVKNDPGNAGAHYYLGAAYQDLGNLDGAESEWLQAMRLRPDQLQTVRSLALLAMRKGDTETLAQSATQMIALQPTSAEGYALRAAAETTQNKFADAEKDAGKSIEVSPQSAYGYVQMGNLRFAQKNFPEARKYFQQALDRNTDSADALRGLMNTYFAEKKFDQAVSAVNGQIARSAKNSGFYDLLGVASSRNKDIKGAEAAFAKALELDANNFDALINLGQVESSAGQTDQAISLFEKSLKNHPRQLPLYFFLGQLYESKRDWKSAEQTYQRALVVKPDDPSAANNLANVLVEEGGDIDQ